MLVGKQRCQRTGNKQFTHPVWKSGAVHFFHCLLFTLGKTNWQLRCQRLKIFCKLSWKKPQLSRVQVVSISFYMLSVIHSHFKRLSYKYLLTNASRKENCIATSETFNQYPRLNRPAVLNGLNRWICCLTSTQSNFLFIVQLAVEKVFTSNFE